MPVYDVWCHHFCLLCKAWMWPFGGRHNWKYKSGTLRTIREIQVWPDLLLLFTRYFKTIDKRMTWFIFLYVLSGDTAILCDASIPLTRHSWTLCSLCILWSIKVLFQTAQFHVFFPSVVLISGTSTKVNITHPFPVTYHLLSMEQRL